MKTVDLCLKLDGWSELIYLQLSCHQAKDFKLKSTHQILALIFTWTTLRIWEIILIQSDATKIEFWGFVSSAVETRAFKNTHLRYC